MHYIKLIVLSLLIVFIGRTVGWDYEELEIFDLVEEISQNFYELMDIKQDASLSEIKKAFRKLSIVLHPDKSDAEDANIQFRNLVSVYDVLKEPSKREKYDNVLKNGLPNWKSAVYYYRRAHKMSIRDMVIILLVVLTVGQYIILWAAYAEKIYTTEILLGSKIKKQQKKSGSSVTMDTILNEIPKPSVYDTIPFLIPRAIWHLPGFIKQTTSQYSQYVKEKAEEQRIRDEEEENQRLMEEKYLKDKEARKDNARKRKPLFIAKEKTDEELKGYSNLSNRLNDTGEGVKPVVSKGPLPGGLWTDEDLAELIRLVKKYPGGTASRWDTIAEQMNRNVQEITIMAAKMKENGYRLPGQPDSVAETIILEATKKIKSKRDVIQTATPTESIWTQEQQQLLESAIVKYPKTNSATDRWQKIANMIPGKTKEECLARYRYLCEIVKAQRKMTTATDPITSNSTNKTDDDKLVDDQQDVPDDQFEGDDIVTNEIPTVKVVNGGKPRNKRKERKKKMEFGSSDEDDEFDN